jgi:hypothetical protein
VDNKVDRVDKVDKVDKDLEVLAQELMKLQ